MITMQDVRRRRDGSIDIDFYHSHSMALRRQAMRDASVLRQTVGAGLLMVCVLGPVGLLAPLAKQGTGGAPLATTADLHKPAKLLLPARRG